MIEDPILEVNVDKIMEKIRRNKDSTPDVRISSSKDYTSLPKSSKVVNQYHPASRRDLSSLAPTVEMKARYHIRELLRYKDDEFINNAYWALLRRAPDSEGFHSFLSKLRSGAAGKTEVIGLIRFSPEGLAWTRNVKLRGLSWRLWLRRAFRISGLNYLVRGFAGIARIPRIVRKVNLLDRSQREISNSNEALYDKLNELIGSHNGLIADLREINGIFQKWESSSQETRDKLSSLSDQLNHAVRKIHDHKFNFLEQEPLIKVLLEEAHQPSREREHLLETLYSSFEDKFRGAREDIKNRQKIYIQYILPAGAGTDSFPVVDLGCGRGEWLDVLRESGLRGRGVDRNQTMAAECRELGLDVECADALEYLGSISSASIGAVTGFHILEHLPLPSVLGLIDESLRVLKPEGVAIFETPNPENVLVGSYSFHIDPTHRNVLPCPTLCYLMETLGFSRVTALYLHPNSGQMIDSDTELANRFNHYFYGPQDYAVMGYKI